MIFFQFPKNQNFILKVYFNKKKRKKGGQKAFFFPPLLIWNIIFLFKVKVRGGKLIFKNKFLFWNFSFGPPFLKKNHFHKKSQREKKNRDFLTKKKTSPFRGNFMSNHFFYVFFFFYILKTKILRQSFFPLF